MRRDARATRWPHATPGSPLPLLSYSTESGLGRILREVRGAALERCPAHSVFTAHLASVLRTMALDGRGMAWLPQTLIRDDLASGRLIEAAPQEWTIELEIRLYRDRSPLGKAAEEFWSAVCAAAEVAASARALELIAFAVGAVEGGSALPRHSKAVITGWPLLAATVSSRSISTAVRRRGRLAAQRRLSASLGNRRSRPVAAGRA